MIHDYMFGKRVFISSTASDYVFTRKQFPDAVDALTIVAMEVQSNDHTGTRAYNERIVHNGIVYMFDRVFDRFTIFMPNDAIGRTVPERSKLYNHSRLWDFINEFVILI